MSKLPDLYHLHHLQGRRLNQSFLEERRSDLFRTWLGEGGQVLDLGCRDGILTRHYAPGNDVVGLDIDFAALGSAVKDLGIQGVHATLNGGLPFPDESFDAVVMAEVLEHLPYLRITLAEVRRLLRPGGSLIGSVPLAYHLHDRWRVLRGKKLLVDGDPTHLQHLTLDGLKTALEDCFRLQELVVLKGQGWGARTMRLLARNVAFRCRKA